MNARFLFFFLLLAFLSSGCLNQGNLTLIPKAPEETYVLSGKVVLSEPVETELMASVRTPLADAAMVADYSKFFVSTPTRRENVAASGAFSIDKVPYSETLVVVASAGKVVLKRRIFPRELALDSLSDLTIDVDSTARALIWEAAHGMQKELTEADIAAREHESRIASIVKIIRFALLMPKKDVPLTILDLAMIKTPVLEAANVIQAQEASLLESHSVIYHGLIREDQEILKYYFSTGFTNDFDSTSNYQDVLAQIKSYLHTYTMKTASYTTHQIELLPNNLARVRTSMEAGFTNFFSGQDGTTGIYVSDVIWRRESTFWKIFRNFPYKSGHPTQIGADGRWGEIARAHAELQDALFREDMNVLKNRISQGFDNTWDTHSNYTDIMNTAKTRFDKMDVKAASYTIHLIDFNGSDIATVKCSGHVVAVDLETGKDIDSGIVHAVVEWHRENGTWKIFRGLSYRFSHPKAILGAIRWRHILSPGP